MSEANKPEETASVTSVRVEGVVMRAERFLELAGRLERRAGNPRIVRILAVEPPLEQGETS